MSATFNRREFLSLGAATAGAVGLAGCAPSASAQDDVPPSIAALTPMTDGVVPISVDERRGRLEKARGLMPDHGIDEGAVALARASTPPARVVGGASGAGCVADVTFDRRRHYPLCYRHVGKPNIRTPVRSS